MKKYLFGLGAMVVGAGLMFVLMHGEVSADSKPEPFICSERTVTDKNDEEGYQIIIYHCQVGGFKCGLTTQGGISCFKKGLFR